MSRALLLGGLGAGPFDGAAAGFAGADGTDDMVGFAAVRAFDDVRGGLVGLVFGRVVVGESRLAVGLWGVVAEYFGHTTHSKRARDGCGDFTQQDAGNDHNEAENGYPAAEISELGVERMEAEVDEGLDDRDAFAEVLLKELVAARDETEEGDDENGARHAIVAVAAVDEETSDGENDADWRDEIKGN